jgi:biopolymer transport protein ExbB
MKTISKPLLAAIALASLALVIPAFAGDSADKTSAAKPPKDKTILDTFYAGGPLMWPLLACSIGTTAVTVYCFIQISGRRMLPATQAESIGQFMQARDASSAYSLCLAQPNVFSNTMSAALLKVNFERDLANKASMDQAAGEALANEETKLNLWVNYLNVFATIGPMLGLLGTVTGMIASFDMLAAGKSEPADLAGGIGEAMITTAGGLFVGIPAMFLYFYFRNLLQINMANIQKRVTFMLDLLSGEIKIESADYAHAPE